MLLLVTIGLVLVGAVALVIGFVSNSLGPIYLSIACSVIAGIVLVVFSRMARRQEGAPATSTSPSRPSAWGPPAQPEGPPSAPPTRVDVPAAPPPPPPVGRPEPPRPEPEPAERQPVAAGFAPPRRPEPAPDDDDFPIPGYDSLRASQVLDRLPDLGLDELDMVREREERGKNRATVIRRIDLRIDELEAAAAGEPEPEPLAAEPEPAPAGAGRADDDFPIEDYDQLSTDEIIAMLDDLDDDELDMVTAREERGRNRLEILEYIDDMFEEVPVDDGGAPPPAPEPAVTPAPPRPAAKKATAKRAAAKKAPARKGAAKKAAPVAKVPLAKAQPTKAAAGRGAKKAAAASPGTKSAGRRSAAKAAQAPPAAKKAAAKKAPARKRTP